MADKKQPSAKQADSGSSRRFFDRFDEIQLAHQSRARSVTRDYYQSLQEIQQRYEEEAAEAIHADSPEAVQEALTRANERWADASVKARDEANAAAERAFQEYVADLRDAWGKADVETCDLASLGAVAESMLTVAGRASGAIAS